MDELRTRLSTTGNSPESLAENLAEASSHQATAQGSQSPEASTEARAESIERTRLATEVESLRPKSKADLTEMALAHKAGLLTEAFRGRLPTSSELRNLTEELGVELATAVYLRTLSDSNIHGPFARRVRSFDFAGWDQLSVRAAKVEVVVVASNLFQSGRKWADHVEDWRMWARDLGFTTDVIETDPRRSIAANARVIFEHLARSPNRKRVIVTYGQGGAEFRYLLHRRINRTVEEPLPEELAEVRAWINVCGAFAGASTSRYFQENRVRRLLARLRMKVAGRNPIVLAESSSLFPLWRRPLPVPPGMSITSIVGVPYRPQVPVSMSLLYEELAKTTPNDGVVTVVEAAAHPGWIIPVQGMSHRADNSRLEPVFKRVLAVLAETTGILDSSSSDGRRPTDS